MKYWLEVICSVFVAYEIFVEINSTNKYGGHIGTVLFITYLLPSYNRSPTRLSGLPVLIDRSKCFREFLPKPENI